MGKKLHYRGTQSLLLAKRKELWLCVNEGYGCAVDPQGIVVMPEWKIKGVVDYHVLSSYTDFQLQLE